MKTTAEAKYDMLTELDELSGRIERLERYIKTDPDDKELLMGQLKAMMDYKYYLYQRYNKLMEVR